MMENSISPLTPFGSIEVNRSISFFPWKELSPDTQISVLLYFQADSLLVLRTVNREWNRTISQDSLWRTFVQHSYGEIQNCGLSWIHQFLKLRKKWNTFDKAHHHKHLKLDSLCTKVSGKEGESYLPIRGNLGVTTGKHSFFIKILNPSPNFALGIGNEKIEFDKKLLNGFAEFNNGIGWYSDGNIYHFRRKLTPKVKENQKGDIIGFLLDMDKKTLTFYRNETQLLQPLSIIYGLEEKQLLLYPILFMEDAAEVEIVQMINVTPYLPSTNNGI